MALETGTLILYGNGIYLGSDCWASSGQYGAFMFKAGCLPAGVTANGIDGTYVRAMHNKASGSFLGIQSQPSWLWTELLTVNQNDVYSWTSNRGISEKQSQGWTEVVAYNELMNNWHARSSTIAGNVFVILNNGQNTSHWSHQIGLALFPFGDPVKLVNNKWTGGAWPGFHNVNDFGKDWKWEGKVSNKMEPKPR